MRGPSFGATASFSFCLSLALLVTLAVAWSGDGPYSDIVRPTQAQAAEHRAWVRYVTGWTGVQPGGERGEWHPTALERSHMSDVRGVFIGAQVAAAVAVVVALMLLVRAVDLAYAMRLLRNAALGALAVVVVLALFAALAFEAAFLLFHQIFFPQGNFLFSPDSVLLRLYPQAYFYGVTMRIGASFVGLALLLAAAAHASLRRRGASA